MSETPAGEHSADYDRTAKWVEAGWTSPDDILAALTEERSTLAKVREVIGEAQAMDRRGPSQFHIGQDHLPPAFREVNWKAAFEAVVDLLNKIEDAVISSAETAEGSSDE